MYCFFKKYFDVLFLAVLVVMTCAVAFAQDQDQAQSSRFFEAQFRATNAVTMVSGKTFVQFWGVQNIEGMSARFNVSARIALDNAIGANKVRCELKKRSKDMVFAQCTNSDDLDLGLYMLHNGYAVVDRAAVYGSAFESSYIQAEMEAQSQGYGVWSSGSSGGANEENERFILTVGAIFLLFIFSAFVVLSVVIMKGFQKVTDAQNQNMDMVVRERELREKEREIFASMLDSEIKANKSKIEAYLVVYDEMLRDIMDIDKTPRYKKAGDIVQVQPALDRSVFDRNTDKLDILGDSLSSQVVHFYARIKSKPDFINLEPDMGVGEALEIVQKVYDNAEMLNVLSDRIIDLFLQGGYSSEEEY